jgi:PAS domain S-box-containing protein
MKQAKTKKPIKASIDKKKKPGENSQNKKEKKLRILILEDNLADAELMERQLKKDGINFTAQRVDSRSAFLKALKAFEPDLILADFNLPKFNALQALALRNASSLLIPFIIVTGSISEEVAVECMKRGADDYLLKDRLVRLGEAVRHALEIRQLQAEKIIAEEAMQAAAARWRITFDAIKDEITLLATDRTILQANRAFADLVKKPFREIIGKKCYELIHPERRPDSQCPFAKVLKSKHRESGELAFADRMFEVIVDPITDDAGAVSGTVHIITDVTERKRNERALHEMNEIFRLFFKHNPIYVFIKDENIRPVYLSENYEKMLGRPLEKILGKNMDELFPSELFRTMVEDDKEILRDGKPREFIEEFNGRTYSTLKFPIFIEGKSKYLAGYTIDVTERKQAENALKESEDRYRDLVENSQELIFTHDLEGKILQINKIATQLTDFSMEELLSMNVTDLLQPEVRHLYNDYLTEIKTSGQAHGRLRVRTAHGEGRYWEYHNTLRTKGVAVPIVRGLAHDITERERAEKLVQASLSEKEVLLKEIHHRVKNNLQIISGLLTLQAAQIDDERLQRIVKESQNRIWTMALIHQTLYQSGNLVDIDMADYIRALSGNLLSSYAQAAMTPTVSFGLLPLRLAIDKAIPLALVINELLTNALKHAFPDGRPGEIRIGLQECRGTAPGRDRSRPVPTDLARVQTNNTGTARRAPTDENHAPTYELTVVDNGIGLPAGFDPKNQKSLGLQLVAMLAKQLDGSLAIESSGGTSVRIIFSNDENSKKQS